MRVILAKTAGFCYGVERAVSLAHETAKAHGGAMLGSVIHNANVVAELEREGMVFPQRTAGRFVTEDAELIAQARQTLAREQTEEFLSAMRSLGYAPGEISELIEALVKEDGNAQL